MARETKTGRRFSIMGLVIDEVEVEPCYRLIQLARGEKVTCECGDCAARREDEARAAFEQMANATAPFATTDEF